MLVQFSFVRTWSCCRIWLVKMTQMLWPFGFGCHGGSWNFGNVGSAEFLQPFLGSFEFYPGQSKFPGSMKLRIDRGTSACVFTLGCRKHPWSLWGLQWQKNRPSGWPVWPSGNRSASANKKSRALTQNSIFETTYQHPNHIFTSGHPFDPILDSGLEVPVDIILFNVINPTNHPQVHVYGCYVSHGSCLWHWVCHI